MEFPAWIVLGPVRLHPHPVLEGLAYLLGYRLYAHLRLVRGDPLSDLTRLSTVAAAAVGALVGSKLLALLEHSVDMFQHRADLAFLIGGKSIVGGLLGGLIAVGSFWRIWAKRTSLPTGSTTLSNSPGEP